MLSRTDGYPDVPRLTRGQLIARFLNVLPMMSFVFALLVSDQLQANRFDYPHKDPLARLSALSLEELMEIKFVTVFKKPGNVFDSPAAVYSLDANELERSGTVTLPDVLRNIPGMQVAQHNAHSWSVTARGFDGLSQGVNGQFANKFLVLQDGRSLYTPLFSGVSWEAQDILLEDVKRIEVIRGPGASLWGANAVNGVINIITKSARETLGGAITVGAGTEYQNMMLLRYGGKLHGPTFYRFYVKGMRVDNLVESDGHAANDGWKTLRAGFRLDSYGKRSQIMLSGGVFGANLHEKNLRALFVEPPFERTLNTNDGMSGGHLLAHWMHAFSGSSNLSLQVYFDRVEQRTYHIDGRIDTYDLDFHHLLKANRKHELMYGLACRLVRDRFRQSLQSEFEPSAQSLRFVSAFFQDEITFSPYELVLTLGSKIEHNDYTGFEFQPSARLLWKPTGDQSIWLAGSRATRSPSRSEREARLLLDEVFNDDNKAVFTRFVGDSNFDSEQLVAFEAGYRRRFASRFSFDLTAFLHSYDKLRTDTRTITERPMLEGTPHSYLPVYPVNDFEGLTYGAELFNTMYVSRRWQMQAAYSFFQTEVGKPPSVGDLLQDETGRSPAHQFIISSLFEPCEELNADFRVRFVDRLPKRSVPAYVTFDLHLDWSFGPGLSLALVGQNLLKPNHVETSYLIDDSYRTQTASSLVERGFYGKLRWRF